MIWPLRSTSLGRSARVNATRPVTLVSITSSIRSQSVSGSGSVGGARPALLSSRSISPHGGASRARLSSAERSRMSISSGRKASPSSSCKFPQPFAAPAGADRAPAAGHELARRRLAEARRRAGDQDRLHRFPSLSSSRRACTSTSGETPSSSETATKSGSCASRKRMSAASSGGSPARRRSSSVPIPVRSMNRWARRAVTKRCRKRGKG